MRCRTRCEHAQRSISRPPLTTSQNLRYSLLPPPRIILKLAVFTQPPARLAAAAAHARELPVLISAIFRLVLDVVAGYKVVSDSAPLQRRMVHPCSIDGRYLQSYIKGAWESHAWASCVQSYLRLIMHTASRTCAVHHTVAEKDHSARLQHARHGSLFADFVLAGNQLLHCRGAHDRGRRMHEHQHDQLCAGVS